jgi:hypothetical protein
MGEGHRQGRQVPRHELPTRRADDLSGWFAAAILPTPRKDESVWMVTFTPKAPATLPPFRPEAGKELVITISTATIDEMLMTANTSGSRSRRCRHAAERRVLLVRERAEGENHCGRECGCE